MKFTIPKIVTGKFICIHCKEESLLDVNVAGDHCGHMQCCHCSMVFHVYCPTIGGAITIAPLTADDAVEIFKLVEKYKGANPPYILRKTKLKTDFP